MTSYETQVQGVKAQSASSDFKGLKSKYASQLSTLKELFANWSEEDLLFAIQDTDGDLELTVERISEGHVVQWGEVKTKKQKKEEAQKAKATQPTAQQQQQFTTSLSSYKDRAPAAAAAAAARSHSERTTRNGRGGSAYRGNTRASKPPVASHPQTAASWEKQTKANHSSETTHQGGSWASIASAPKAAVNDNSQQQFGANSWDAPTTAASATWGSQPEPESKTPAEPSSLPSTSTANNDASSSPAPKTWASLLKSKPKPEPSIDTKKEDQQTWKEPEPAAASTTDSWDAPNDGWNSAAAANENDAWGAAAPSVDPWEQPVDLNEQTSPLKEEEKEPVPEKVPEPQEPEQQQPSSVAAAAGVEDTNIGEKEQLSSSSPISAANKAKQSTGRRLKQDVPVVLPNSGSAVSDVEVRFGSLGLEDSTESSAQIGGSTKKQDSSASAAEQVSEKQAQQSYLDRYSTNENGPTATTQGSNSLIGAGSLGQASYIKQQDNTAGANVNNFAPQQQQPQQHQFNHLQQQQQHFGMENLTSPYSSYLPNQLPAGVSGFAMNPMASLPDYSLYGSDAQRAAASMGYYDPTAYSHSPSTTAASAYQARDKYGQDAAASANAAQAQLLPQQAQQMYPNMPYYHQYYYMPNQLFGAYQQSGYANPYLNKNMYPMYQPSGKPGGASAASPYGAAGGSPYANHHTQQQQQHLYNPTIPGATGYDDMSPLGGLQDYQKSTAYNQQQPTQQLPGFLGNLSQPSPGGAAQPPANAGQQGQGKADVDNSQYGPQQGANVQHFTQQQHAYQQPNPSNYFNHNQPQQMFYHQQLHMQPQQPQQQQQQQPPAQQAPSIGRQQQYWSQ